MNLPDILSELTACGYACEAGALENNVAWRELERMAQVTQQPLWTNEKIDSEAYDIAKIFGLPDGLAMCIGNSMIAVRDSYEQTHSAMSDAPDSPGWWAWEGYINYMNGANPNKIEREVVRVFWGKTTNEWHVVRERGRHPAKMLIGKWYKLTMPWKENDQ